MQGAFYGIYEKSCKGCGGYLEEGPKGSAELENYSEELKSSVRAALEPEVEKSGKKVDMVYQATFPTLVSAVNYSQEDDWDNEWATLCAAQELARSAVVFGAEKAFQSVQQALFDARLIFRGADLIGTVVAEQASGWAERTGQGGKMFVSKGPDITPSTTLLSDRVLFGKTVFRIDNTTEATIFVDGSDQFVTTKSGTIGLGMPVGGLGVGLGATSHKNKLQDSRVCSFVVTAESWQTKTNFPPSQLEVVRPFAERLRRHLSSFASPESSPASTDIAEQLTKLGQLFANGLIDEAEFKASKAKLLGL